MSDAKATNITWHAGRVARADRRRVLGHAGATIWMTGLSGSGKSTVAVALEEVLIARGCLAYRLDGDNVRHGLNANLGFSPEDRTENIRRIGEVSRLFADAGLLTISSFISPYRADRDSVRVMHEEAGLPFLEVHVDVPLEVAESRDPKGLYARARAGEIRNFTGLDAPYEAPETPEMRLPTHELSVDESAAAVVEMLIERGLLDADQA